MTAVLLVGESVEGDFAEPFELECDCEGELDSLMLSAFVKLHFFDGVLGTTAGGSDGVLSSVMF